MIDNNVFVGYIFVDGIIYNLDIQVIFVFFFQVPYAR